VPGTCVSSAYYLLSDLFQVTVGDQRMSFKAGRVASIDDFGWERPDVEGASGALDLCVRCPR
jgi:hypothetical protein